MLKQIEKIFDVLLCCILFIYVILPVFFLFFIKAVFTPRKKVDPNNKKVLVMLNDQLSALQKKGVYTQIFDRDLDNYFKHVFTIHIFSDVNQTLEPRSNYTIIEYGPTLSFFKYTSYLLTELRILFSLYFLINREKISVIRSLDPFFSGLNSLMLARATGIPVVVNLVTNYQSIYDNTNMSAVPMLKFRFIEQALELFVYNEVDLILPGSVDIINTLKKKGVSELRMRLTRKGGLSKEFFSLNKNKIKPAYLSKGKKIISYIGRLSKEKHPEDVILCAFELLKKRKDCIFYLAGGGDIDTYKKLASKLNINKSVIFTDFLSPPKVWELIKSSDIIVSPLTGNSLREAAFFERPIVAYNIDWQPELIIDNKTGILVPYRDYTAMAAGVLKLLNNSKLAQKLGKEVSKFLLKENDPKFINKNERKIFDELLNN